MKKFGFVGGDLRNIRLAEILSKEENKIYTYGLENYSFDGNIDKCLNILECIEKSEYIIGPIPLSKDGRKLNNKFSKEEIYIENIFKEIKNKKFITGAVNNEIRELANKEKLKLYDIMQDEDLTILNVIPTVEGAIQIAMQETEKTIHGSNILVLGFGRIGKLLSKTLYNMGAKVTCEARKESDIAWITAYGYKSLKLEKLTENLKNEKYDIIFNTIPYLILDKERLFNIDEQCLLIDLASKPGGIDFNEAERLKIKTNWALALPGKVAPKTAAEYIKQSIYKIVN